MRIPKKIFCGVFWKKEIILPLWVLSVLVCSGRLCVESRPLQAMLISFVEFAPDKHTFDNFMELSFLLEYMLGRKVDIVTPEALSPYIGPHILKEVERVAIAA